MGKKLKKKKYLWGGYLAVADATNITTNPPPLKKIKVPPTNFYIK